MTAHEHNPTLHEADGSPGTRIQDIANEAGVSVSTVSRVINGRPDVAKATRQRVESAIDKFSYSPNPGARRLASGRTHTIAIIYPLENVDDAGSSFALDIIRGAASTAESRGYVASLVTSPTNPRSLRALYESNHADGTIILEVTLEDWRIDLLRSLALPVVALGRPRNEEGLPYVDMDFDRAMSDAVAYLYREGRRNIAMLGRRERQFGPTVRSRRGFLEATTRLLGQPGLYLEVDKGSSSSADAIDELLATAPDVSAILISDNVAYPHVVRRLHEFGRAVPDDIAIVSFAPNALAELVTPTLTTVNFDQYSAGVDACNMILDVIEGRPRSEFHRLLQPILTVRASS